MTENFWKGFEKQAAGAGLLTNVYRTVAKGGHSLSQAGKNLASNTGTGFVDQMKRTVGQAAQPVGQFIRKNPRGVTAGLGVAGVGAGAVGASKMMGASNNA
jgi:hypothetical protein